MRRGRTASTRGGTCTSPPARAARASGGSRARARCPRTSCRRLLQDLVHALLQPVEAARLDGLRQARPGDQDVVLACRHVLELGAPTLSKLPLESVADDGAAELLRDGDPE